MQLVVRVLLPGLAFISISTTSHFNQHVTYVEKLRETLSNYWWEVGENICNITYGL